jgi:hypothetical protein
MKLCLAVAFQNEQPWLELHLPAALRAESLAGLVALDGGSEDGSAAVIKKLKGKVQKREFDWDFSAHMNTLIDLAESAGYDALIRLDPDELMFPEHIDAVAALLEQHKAVRLPRINFEVDREHYCPTLYPDFQLRVFRLGEGVRYSGRVHESLDAAMARAGWRERHNTDPDQRRDLITAPHLPIFHYEGLKDGPTRQLKGLNYQRVGQGQKPQEKLPWNFPAWVPRWNLPFVGPQPLDPAEIGTRAPIEERD